MPKVTRRDFVATAISAGLGATLTYEAVARTASEPSFSPVDPLTLVDPELLAPIKASAPIVLTKGTLPHLRPAPGPQQLKPAPAPQPLIRKVPGPKGAPDIKVLLFDPTPGARNRPAMLHIHGGGYVLSSVETFQFIPQQFAQECGCLVVSVDYRLAPETPFPGALEDNYAALRWLFENADSLGVDRKRIAIGGESAGGGHTAALVIAARDRKEFTIAFQLLTYPMLDDRTGSTREVPSHMGTYVWTRQSNVFGWTALLDKPAGSATVPAGAVPARVADLSGLPPTFIGVGSLDLFLEEDISYATRLIQSGVPTELLVVPGAYHAFDTKVPQARVSKQFKTSMYDALRRALGT